MDFELSDDQRALQDAAADLLDSLSSTEQVRAMAAKEEPYDAVLWKAMVEQGWTGVELSEQQVGRGLGMVEAAVLAEQVGAHVAPAPFIENLLAVGVLVGTDQDAWTERLVTGDAVACVAWRPDIPVPYAPVADVAVVISQQEVHLVDMVGGTAIEREPAMDLTRPLGWLHIEGRQSTAVGGPAEAGRLLDRDAARRVMAGGLQVHGGIGFTWEHDLHLFMKRSQLDQLAFGDGAYHRERLGTLLRESLERTPPVC